MFLVDWAVKMRIRPPEFETSICDAKYHVSLSTRSVLGKCVYLVRLAMSLFDLQDVCIAIGSLATLDLPMVVDLIGIYGLKGPYCTLTTTNWFFQALSVIPRGSWGDVSRRFTMIRWAGPELPSASRPSSLPQAAAAAAAAAARRRRKFVSGQFDEEKPFVLISSVLLVQADEGVLFLVVDRIGDIYRNLPRRADVIVTTVGARHKCQQAGSPATYTEEVDRAIDIEEGLLNRRSQVRSQDTKVFPVLAVVVLGPFSLFSVEHPSTQCTRVHGVCHICGKYGHFARQMRDQVVVPCGRSGSARPGVNDEPHMDRASRAELKGYDLT
ncbi:hypothetical protein F511_32276 [Dorcoceras hygrometricum]|uniref:Uncharacterized protein n=1 Tax=Dorcoceras hygrometricum TaxID=472368 RepID=A0A2Z7CFP6_9LAMI|nr:hypothetical protein F511_32276 [Dorcoceras hygrometricum]